MSDNQTRTPQFYGTRLELATSGFPKLFNGFLACSVTL